MRNKYSKQFEKEMINESKNKTLFELLEIAINKYHYKITERQLQLYLSKRKIRYKNYHKEMAREMGLNKNLIGTEYIKPDGMTLVKVSKDKWKYKQRLIYEKYYKKNLNDDEFIIFLDQNRNNFNINNLKKITRRESAVMASNKLFNEEPKITETGILVANIMIENNELLKLLD